MWVLADKVMACRWLSSTHALDDDGGRYWRTTDLDDAMRFPDRRSAERFVHVQKIAHGVRPQRLEDALMDYVMGQVE